MPPSSLRLTLGGIPHNLDTYENSSGQRIGTNVHYWYGVREEGKQNQPKTNNV
jgi:hypothetical protein